MTTPTFSCIVINGLEETSFIAGNKYTFNFDIYDNNEVSLNMDSSTFKWRMAYYNFPTIAILEKTGIYADTPNNRFTITLEKTDTENLSGKFIHQPAVIDIAGTEYKLTQGIITIIGGIPTLESTEGLYGFIFDDENNSMYIAI